MIQAVSRHFLQKGKHFSILKFIILQQNISSVWIFCDPCSSYQYGQEIDAVIQNLVGALPKYVFDTTQINKITCTDNEDMKNLNIFFVAESFGYNELRNVCEFDYSLVLAQNASVNLYPKEISHRIAFCRVNSSDISEIKQFEGSDTLHKNIVSVNDLFTTNSIDLNKKYLRIFFHLAPPKSMMFLIGDEFRYFGPDALLAHEMSKMLNMTPVTESDVGYEYSNESLTAMFVKSSPQYQKGIQLLEWDPKNLRHFYISNLRQKYVL